MSTVSKALGTNPVIVILEPDSLALQTCLNASEATARGNALSAAVTTIKSANPAAKVWTGTPGTPAGTPRAAAQRLTQAGVSKSDGFYSNVSNFRTTAAEISFGQQVLVVARQLLAEAGDRHQPERCRSGWR